MKKTLAYALLLAVMFVLPTSSNAATHMINIGNFFFNPASLMINQGDTVIWTNNVSGSHSTTSGSNCSPDGIWDSGLLGNGETFERTFNSAGAFPYYCKVSNHCASFGMEGTITVLPSSQIPLPAGKDIFSYDPVGTPEMSSDPSLMKPIGFGSAATGGGTLTVAVNMGQFAGSVDVYAAYLASAAPQTLNVLNPGLTFTPLSFDDVVQSVLAEILPEGAMAWMGGVSGPINTTLFSIPTSQLPSGTYQVFIMVTPASNLSSFYIWQSFFVVP